MSKVAVIYWSGTGNTEIMANAIADGIKDAGTECEIFPVSNITSLDAAAYSKLVLGCPSMGAEVLEETEFEPFFEELENNLAGRKVALFGSYGWGDGQWMRDWVKRTDDTGANIYTGEGFIVNETPDADKIEECKKFGAGFAAF